MTKLHDLAGDILAYAAAAASAQAISHYTFAIDPVLPESWPELVLRYSAGSSVVFGLVGLYALRHSEATATEGLLIHGAVLAGSGIAVALLHRADERRKLAEAAALERRYQEEDAGHVASPPTPRLISLPLSRRAGH